MKVLCIGHSSWDITVPVDEYPVENVKYRYNEKYSAGGGPAANAAYLLGKWGIDTTIACTIGSDDFGTNIKKEFSEVGVNTEYIETNYEKDTSLSMVMINKKNGSRTVFNVATEHPPLKKVSYDFTPDVILTDGHDYNASTNAITKYPNAISVLDAGRNVTEVIELCKYVKYIVCSKGFAETFTGLKFDYNNPQNLVNIYNKIQDKYPNSSLVITLEEHGALYQNGNEIKIMPGLKIEAVDTTGAGDIFHGAFVYGLVNGFDMDKMITLANIAAGLSCKKIGSRLAVPTLSEVLEYYNNTLNSQMANPNSGIQPGVTEQPAAGQPQPQQEVTQVQSTVQPGVAQVQTQNGTPNTGSTPQG